MAGSYGRSALLCLVLAAQAAADGVYPFSDGIATYQVTSGNIADPAAYSKGTPLQAYLVPQDPYYSAILPFLQPPLDLCGGPQLQDSDLLQVSKAVSNASSRGFPDYFRLAHAAAIWGFPSVQVATAFAYSGLNTTAAFPTLALNGIVNYANPIDATHQASAGIQDTNFLYSLAWLDLSGGPLVLSLPDTGGRFYEIQFTDVYNSVPYIISPLVSPLGTGITSPLNYVLAATTYSGMVSTVYNYTLVSDSMMLWMTGRVRVIAGNASDLAAAQATQAGIGISPLNKTSYKKPFGSRDVFRRATVALVKPYTLWGAPGSSFGAKEDYYPISWPGPNNKNASAFWELLGAMTAVSPPQDPAQAALLANFSSVGLSTKGFGFSPDALPDAALAGLNVGLAAALGCVLTQARARQGQLLTPTRWEPLMGVADFGHKYLARAAGAVAGLGVNPAGVSIAYLTRSATDRDSWGPGQPLDGYQFNYTLSFTEAPPASATWRRAARPRAPCSLQQRPAYMLHCLLNYIYVSAYAQDGSVFADVLFDPVTKALRYSVSDATPGIGAAPSIFVSSSPPPAGSALHAGWLPVGARPFFLVLRLYGPGAAAQQGSYSPPPLYAFQGPPD